MNRALRATIAAVGIAPFVAAVAVPNTSASDPVSDETAGGGEVAELFTQVTASTEWRVVDQIDLDFETYHPQGMALVDDLIYLSSVEIIEPTVPYPEPIDGYDRSPGKGQGHVFVLTRDGELIADIEVGEGDMYHPGGIDYDGRHVWVPVGEYRPDSASLVYTIVPHSHRVVERFQSDDHIGSVVAQPATDRLAGVSWGSRQLFAWDRRGNLRTSAPNPSHYVDFQDCAYMGSDRQLCTGVNTLAGPDDESVTLGGAALMSISDNQILHEVPIQLYSSANHSITRNPVAFEADGNTLRMFAAPDDGDDVEGTQVIIVEANLDE